MTRTAVVVWKDGALVQEDPNERDDPTSEAGGPAIEQFQQAALDAVRAARALLDAAESVIQDPAAIEAMVKTVASVAKSASDVVAGFAAPTTPHPDGDEGPIGSDDDPDGFETIAVG